jgi:phosphoribosyl 1,2-cyclic phosphodiesterase
LIQNTTPNFTLCPLASGSSGNAIYISDGTTSILIDAGLSGAEIQRRMKARGLRAEDLDAILITHEHADHIRGAGVLSRRHNIPVYLNEKTWKAAEPILGKTSEIREFQCGTAFSLNGVEIHPFSISHDAEDPSGFTFQRNGTKIGIATDLGIATAMVKHHLQGCALLFLEANHDPDMLMAGPYPWHLKQRIRGRMGHLSNEQSRDLLAEVFHEGLYHVVLGHLSQENNRPEKAAAVVGQALEGKKAILGVARQDTCGELLRV